MNGPLSFRATLTLRWTLAFGSVLALTSLAIYVGVRTFLRADLAAQLRTLASTEQASALDSGLHLHDFPTDDLPAGAYADKFVQLLDARGALVMQSKDLRTTTPLLDPDLAARVIGGEVPLLDVTVDDRHGLMTALRIDKPDGVYVIAVGLYLNQLDATLGRLAWLLFGVSALGLGLTAVVGYALATRALRPIAHITERAGAIARGNFSTTLEPPVRLDEIGRMTALLNEMLDRLRGALDANQRFAADASHELRGPLTAVLGEIDVTLKRERSPGEYRESLAEIREHTQELTDIIHNLLVLVRAQEGDPPPLTDVPIEPLIRAQADRLTPLADARAVRIDVQPMPSLCVYAEPALLARVFDNVMRNAVQYNTSGGSVSISAVHEQSDDVWATGVTAIKIRDTGMGIPEAARERVFERFYRTDRSRSRRTGGTGIGLSIASEVVRLFGGSIRVTDSSAAGTTVEIRLPGSGPVPAAPSAPVSSTRV